MFESKSPDIDKQELCRLHRKRANLLKEMQAIDEAIASKLGISTKQKRTNKVSRKDFTALCLQ